MTTWHPPTETSPATKAGLRFGDRGTHTSRTMMLAELTSLLDVQPPESTRADYLQAIVDDNVLGKNTEATRKLTGQRLAELYGLDPSVPIFRALLRVWRIDEAGRPVTALLCALARDPLLRSTASTVLQLDEGEELVRSHMLDALRKLTGDRLNDSILDKVARNAGSSWSQSGHLEGRVRKIRQRVAATPGSLALALWLGSLEDLAGEQLLDTRWTSVFDQSPRALEAVVLRAKQIGLVNANIGGGTTEIDASGLDSVL
jgi:hypothetical protein